MLAADVAEHRRPVIEADADRQRRLAPRRSRSSFQLSSASASCRRSAARWRRRRGLASGSPNTAKISSPIYFSTVPPQAKICAVIRSWNSRSMRHHRLGRHASAMRVKPTMSTNSTATVCRRTAPDGSSCAASISTMFGEK